MASKYDTPIKLLKVGDIIEITWTDVSAYDAMSIEDILKDCTKDPLPTVCWGKIIKILPKSLLIAHEESPKETQGCHASIYPFKLIDHVRLLEKGKVKK
jgi:hypothetical protein